MHCMCDASLGVNDAIGLQTFGDTTECLLKLTALTWVAKRKGMAQPLCKRTSCDRLNGCAEKVLSLLTAAFVSRKLPPGRGHNNLVDTHARLARCRLSNSDRRSGKADSQTDRFVFVLFRSFTGDNLLTDWVVHGSGDRCWRYRLSLDFNVTRLQISVTVIRISVIPYNLKSLKFEGRIHFPHADADMTSTDVQRTFMNQTIYHCF